MVPSDSNRSRLRLTAVLVGLAATMVLARTAASWSVGYSPITHVASWMDRLTLWLQPLLGLLGILAAVGLWGQRRWGGAAFTAWALLVAAQVSLLALMVAAMAGLAWQPLLTWLGVMGVVLFLAYRLVGAVWRWLSPSA